MSAYIRLHRGQYVDCYVPAAVGVEPSGAPSDVVLSLSGDINPSKVIQVTQNVQASDPVTGQLLFNPDGTPKWEIKTVTNPDGSTSTVIVTAQVPKTVYLQSSPTNFTMDDIKSACAASNVTCLQFGSFEQVQQAQVATLENAMNTTLGGGFTAKTLVGGATTPHTYPTDANAQANFNGLVNAFSVNPNKTSAIILTLDAGWISHTKAEFYGVYSDGDAWKEAQYTQLTSLVAKVESATTVADVQAITWTEATY